MAMKRWKVGKPDRELAKLLGEECETDPFTALIACTRGITDSSELELMLSSEPILCDTYELADIKKAADIINDAINSDTLIAVFGDYDCDGIVSTAIMYDYLTSRNAKVTVYIPDRISEGYGMNKSAIDKLKEMGVGLIITVDNGISCFEEIAYANELGITTVITDHHIPPEILPDAAAIVDPHRVDCPSSFKEICGAMVAYKVICAISDKEPEQLLNRYADLLCIATVGDVMPLINENRSVVRFGINMIKSAPRVGVSAIMNVAGIERTSINSGRISFGIVPRINASGRMGNAIRAFNLLTSNNMLDALKIANELDEENAKRQALEKEIMSKAVEEIENNNYRYNRVIVVSGDNWHCGVVGIVASRITEKYSKPAIVLSLQDGIAHGSGRSFTGFHLYNAIDSCGEVLEKYGGHELAAGVTVKQENIDIFRKKINEFAQGIANVVPNLNIDFRINPSGMSVDMVQAIKVLEPFGVGNPTPVFGLFGVKLEKITPIGSGKHLKLLFSKDGGAFVALLFGVTEKQFCFEIGDILDLAVTLDTSLYKEEYNLSVQIKAIRMNGVDEDKLFDGIDIFERYMSGENINASDLLPTRQEAGLVFKKILGNSVNTERFKYIFANDLGYAKMRIALTVLCELGLADIADGCVTAVKNAQKSDLLNSDTYKKLYERVNGI